MSRIPRLDALTPRARLSAGLLIGLAVAAGMWGLRRVPFLDDLEMAVVDLRTRTYADESRPDPRVVVAEISDPDVQRLQHYSPWPWPLDFEAAAFRVLGDLGARVVAVDAYYMDQGAGPEDVLGRPTGELEATKLAAGAEEGETLRAALAGLPRSVLAYQLSDVSNYGAPARLEAARARLLVPGVDFRPVPGYERPHAEAPVSRASLGATALGFANAHVERDGVVRRAFVAGRWGPRATVSLPLAAAFLATEGEREISPGRVRLGPIVQRLNDDGSFLVNLRGRAPDLYPRVPVADLITLATLRQEPPEALDDGRRADRERLERELGPLVRDKVVVFGVWLAGHEDNVASALGSMHGPVFQATVIDNLLNGDGRVRAPAWLDVSILFATCLVLGAAGMTLATRWATLLSAAVVVGGIVLAFQWFRAGTSLDVVLPLLGAFFTWGGASGFRLFTEGRRNRWLEGTFGRYLAPEIIEALKEDPTRLQLGGRRRELTILFSDVAGFTKFSELLPPEQLTHLLNRYLSAHAAAVMAVDGVVDKFMGDGVMAFFGDPIEVPDHALRACRCALATQRIPPTLADLCRQLGIPDLVVRVGLNTGPAVVGNMGSEERLEYTVMGDTVNLASRLEGANKAFGSRILIGALTYEEAKAGIVARPLGDLVVVGKGKDVAVHELLGIRGETDEATAALAEAFARAQEAARRGDLPAAREALAACERLRPGDPPTAWFRGVLDRLEAEAPGAPWSGRVVLESK